MAFVGSIRVPSDKSISHRAVLFAGLAQGVSHLEAVLPSADVHATIDAMRLLGAHVDLVPGPHGLTGTVEGIGCARGSGTRAQGARGTGPGPPGPPPPRRGGGGRARLRGPSPPGTSPHD